MQADDGAYSPSEGLLVIYLARSVGNGLVTQHAASLIKALPLVTDLRGTTDPVSSPAISLARMLAQGCLGHRFQRFNLLSITIPQLATQPARC